jgi:FkbM family methyltransferase
MKLKQFIVGTPIGHAAVSLRRSIGLVKAALRCPEQLGSLANDHLATRLVTKLCPIDRVFVDVGAHIGSIIAEVIRHDPDVKIIAIEAIPEKADVLKRKFPKVSVHQCAAGEADGETTFYVNTEASGYSSLGRPNEPDDRSIVQITVPMRRLDDLVSDDVGVIKIDVEDAELGVLRGGVKILTECRPVVLFESGPRNADGLGYTKEDLYRLLKQHEYVTLVPARLAHNDPGLSEEGFLESHLFPRRTTNYFAVPAESREQVRDAARAILNIVV